MKCGGSAAEQLLRCAQNDTIGDILRLVPVWAEYLPVVILNEVKDLIGYILHPPTGRHPPAVSSWTK